MAHEGEIINYFSSFILAHDVSILEHGLWIVLAKTVVLKILKLKRVVSMGFDRNKCTRSR